MKKNGWKLRMLFTRIKRNLIFVRTMILKHTKVCNYSLLSFFIFLEFAHELFRLCDEDGNGDISFEEFKTFFKKLADGSINLKAGQCVYYLFHFD